MPIFDVSPAAPHELLPACRLLFNTPDSEPARERLLSAGAESGLLVARAGGRVRAAALAQSLPGALGVTCPPRGDFPEATGAVAAAACDWLRARGVKVCQAFADADEAGRMGPLERAGFRYTTQLAFLRRGLSADDAPVPGPRNTTGFEAGQSPFSDAFAAALVATHEATRDCPELNAPRSPAEVLDGFTATHGDAFLARRGTEPVGVVMLETGARPAVAELTYLGVVPAARARGFGSDLLAFALAEAARGGADALALSVDARNTPAVRLYTKFGFVEYERRGVWLATWPA